MASLLHVVTCAAALWMTQVRLPAQQADRMAEAPATLAPGAIPAAVMLYPHGAPGALGQGEQDKPRIYPFLPAHRSTRASVLILPGGG